MDIELRLLRSLVAIYERGSISRAAEQLHCTQAAMSMRLKMLEEEVGTPLFLRRHQRMEPTPRGSEIYAKALAVLASYDELISATRSRAELNRLRIGVPDDYALGILGNIIRDADAGMAALELDIHCDLSANLVAALQRRELDCALVTLAAPPLAAQLVAETELCWVFQPGQATELQRPVLLAAYPEGCVFRRAMIMALEQAGLPWRVAVQSRSHAGILTAIRAGLAVTSMAKGTVPADLVAATSVGSLPSLGRIPIHLMQSPDAPDRVMARIKAALQRHFAPVEGL